jgi:TonB family protein
MTDDRAGAGEDTLAPIDLHAWRIPPAPAIHGPSLLARAVSSPAAPAKRGRTRWMLAAIVLINAAIAALLVIVLARPAQKTTVVAQPAGGGSMDAKVDELLHRLEQERLELERRLAEIEKLRALVAELSEKIRLYEQQTDRQDRTVPKQRQHPVPAPERVATPPVNPLESDHRPCQEVACVLSSNPDPCCAAFRKRPGDGDAKAPSTTDLPDTLTRASISTGIAAVKARVTACGNDASTRGKVKLRIEVSASGRVSSVSVAATPDAALGACVAAAVRRAVFSRTRSGGSFSYPFVF